MRGYHKRRSDGVKGDHEKKSDGVRVDNGIKSDGVRVHHEKEQWGEFTIRKRAMG